jgi:hypothetical protein
VPARIERRYALNSRTVLSFNKAYFNGEKEFQPEVVAVKSSALWSYSEIFSLESLGFCLAGRQGGGLVTKYLGHCTP